MKKSIYLLALLACWVTALHSYSANVVPVSGTYYNIVQLSSSNILGTVSDYPAIQAPSNSLGQAFKFTPVDGLSDTYYIQNGYGKYVSKAPGSNWDVSYLDAPDGNTSQWTIVDDASSSNAFRLTIVYNGKYLASDGTSDGSRVYYDKTNTNANGIYTLQASTFPSDLISTYNSYTLGDLSNVTSDLSLPTTIGSNVSVVWTSSRPDVISTSGVVTRVQNFNAYCVLTATMSSVVNGVTYTLTKQFTATVPSVNEVKDEIAQWNFKSNFITLDNSGSITVADSISGFVGTLKNDARIRTIGSPDSDQFNVLDLGNGKGYFDLGTDFGQAIYSLKDYTVCGYFRIDDSYDVSTPGNFMYSFSNSTDIATDPSGYIIGILNNQSHKITAGNWSGEQGAAKGKAASKGSWHHFLYTQNGNTGMIFIDGVPADTATVTYVPATTLVKAGRTGTLYNWLGRSCYASDNYLRNTLLYDFRLFSIPLTVDDIGTGYLEVTKTLDYLNNAYATNPDYLGSELATEVQSLSLGDLSGVKTNLELPSKGKIDPTITIAWKSSNPLLIDATGVVTRPDYYNYTDTLTATLVKNGQSAIKKFYATVVANDGTAFANDLLVKYDFSQYSTSDSTVTDVAEKHFVGKFKKDASIGSIGTSTVYKVLNLGDSIGYFDMGAEIGKLMYSLQDFSLSAYYRIDNSYSLDELKKNGNFLWNFSNSDDILNKAATGYLIGSLRNQAVTITPNNWNGEQTVLVDLPASQGSWHNMTYTQSGTTGTLYVDGLPVVSKTITQLPKNTLAKEASLGTAFNWIGRSCYTGDVYLRNALVYDFRLYRVALSDTQIQTSELNVANTITALDKAYSESGGLNSINTSTASGGYVVKGGTGYINVSGLNGTEIVSVYDLSGRLLVSTSKSMISAKPGIYIVKIKNDVSKVVVK